MATRSAVIEDLRLQMEAIGSKGAESDSEMHYSTEKGRGTSIPVPESPQDGGEGFACKDDSQAFKKIVALLTASDRSEKAIRERLSKYEFTVAEIESAIDRAKDYGFIDDSRFAWVLVRSRISQGKGAAGIERDLMKNGIDPSTVEGWPEAYGIDEDSEVQRALDLLERKPPRSKNLREGAYRKLVQKGYSSPVASRASREWFDGLEIR